jgi:Ran GTPase-activating protein (RanGAP) involved in mRNA processing and transport
LKPNQTKQNKTIPSIIFYFVIFHVFVYIVTRIYISSTGRGERKKMNRNNKRNFDYYKSHAQDVKLRDITSSERNATILEILRDGDYDPYWNRKLYLLSEEIDADDPDEFVIGPGDDMGWLGYFIGRSTQLEEFHIKYFPEEEGNNDKEVVNEFMEGMKHNESIQEMFISTDLGREGFQHLGYMLRNNSEIENLCLHEFDIGIESARSIALMLGQEQCKSLKHLFFVQNDLCAEGLQEIVTALRTQTQLEELKLCGNNIDSNGCVALGDTLKCWKGDSLRKLHLCHNDIDDDGLQALIGGMNKCNLEVLTLCGNPSITTAGLRSLSTFLLSDNCCLERLDLDETNIGMHGGMGVLATGLSRNMSLKCLCLSGNSIDNEGVNALVSGLPKGCKLEELHLSDNGVFSAAGLKSLSSIFQTVSNLKQLHLRGNAIDDNGLKALVEGMTNCCSLTKLDLSHNESVTADGLRALLRSDHCSLKELELWGMRIGDERAVALADGLVGNKSMERLYFCPGSSGITDVGWSAFSRLLCDTSSVNNTFLSNHTLTNIGGYESHGPPVMTRFYLFLNNFCIHRVSILKILMHHRDIDVEPLFRWKLMFLPLVVAWFHNARPIWEEIRLHVHPAQILLESEMSLLHEFFMEDLDAFQSRELSAVYKFVRDMPMLAIGKEEDGS